MLSYCVFPLAKVPFLISRRNYYILCSLNILYILLCTCRCEPATKQSSVCAFIPSHTNYHIVVSNESEAVLQSFVALAHSKNNKCNQFIVFSVCFYLFRNCELRNTSVPSSGLQLSICQSKCSDFIELIVECIDDGNFETVLNDSNYNEAVHKFVAWTFNFNCYGPTSYAVPGIPISNTSCDNLSSIDDLLPSASAGKTNFSYRAEL